MATTDAQKSEIHRTTADSSSAPTGERNDAGFVFNGNIAPAASLAPGQALGPSGSDPEPSLDDELDGEEAARLFRQRVEPLNLPAPADERQKLYPPGTIALRDESDVGGPIELRMDDGGAAAAG